MATVPLLEDGALSPAARAVFDDIGERHPLGQTFFQPTVLTQVTPQMKVANEETFGPAIGIARDSGARASGKRCEAGASDEQRRRQR